MIPHRSTALISIVVFVALLLVIFSSSPSPTPDPLTGEEEVTGPAKYVPKLSNFHLPMFRPAAHQPPEQKNSTSGESKWYSHWEWINPFSSSITLDEGRSVLPPLADRPFIYTYYDASSAKNNKEEENADGQLLLAWRRAWYAQGFRPIILGRGEAINNPMYEAVQRMKLNPNLEADMFRWLAWGNMGTGLLADVHCFPMARYDDALLSYLRRGVDPAQISRFDHIGSALFAGDKVRINDAIQDAIQKENTQAKSMLDIISPEIFRVEQPTALAYYSSTSITNHYPEIAEKIVRSPTAGRLALVELINSHLHNTFQNTFPAGIAVLKPFPKYTTALVEPSLRLAKALAQCSTSPMPSSCPPSNQKCHPCSPDKSMVITQPSMYKNTSQLFTIGTLPHPYTLVSLQNNTEEVTSRYIRRETERDAWLKEVTSTVADSELGGSSRAVILKEAVASDSAMGTSLWMTVESLPAEAGQALPSALLDEFEWQFGFKIPRDGNVDQKNEGKAKESMQHANPSEQGIEREYDLLQKARDAIKDKKNNRVHIKDMAEAWNLADTEVWRFVRAYRARSVVERKRWEDEEKDFVGARLKE
ncbi:hypothetical protein SI65_00593 [Aspergillus cristatus]|uniref:Uncharacterized protein n=1 Tax=Aspergillus cristatus TaxID=573508 RepID=A0A1E3BPV2_ASPCR|nr:hypothetical protein SI65_00593 [Aspergillus cristatus]